jgi:hypothetical protein
MRNYKFLGALAILCLTLGIILNSHVNRIELNERQALELAEGKEPAAEKESISMGGTR